MAKSPYAGSRRRSRKACDSGKWYDVAKRRPNGKWYLFSRERKKAGDRNMHRQDLALLDIALADRARSFLVLHCG